MVYAQGIRNYFLPEALGTGFGAEILNRLLSSLLTLVLVGGGLAVFLFVVIGAFQWITSGGDKLKIQQGITTEAHRHQLSHRTK